MNQISHPRDRRWRPGRRYGISLVWPSLAVTLAAGVGVAAWKWRDLVGGSASVERTSLVEPVKQSRFEHYVVERGDLESADNVEIRTGLEITAVRVVAKSGGRSGDWRRD